MLRYLPLWFLVLTACGEDTAVTRTDDVAYSIDSARISVSGVSSGAYMAGQLHLAHSRIFSGAALVAGGPYYCAMGKLSRGLGPCINGGELDLDALLKYARAASSAGEIDDIDNLSDDHVWVFHGELDTVVDQDPTDNAAAMYIDLISDDAVTLVTDVAVVHGLPTTNTGMPCDSFGAPYLNACDYDAAGKILSALYGDLNARTTANGELWTIVQPGFDAAEMLQEAYLYVPALCAAGSDCGIHIALHGCSQSSEYVNDAFAAGAGFNEWADANRLLVLYPQVASSKIAPMNPYGCWDWWGYTGDDYATKNGAQVLVIKATLDALAGTAL